MISTPLALVVVAAIAISTEFVLGHRCFVCTPGDVQRRATAVAELQKSFPVGTRFENCSEFHRSKRDRFLIECPRGSRGCLTKFHGGSATRTCGNAAVDDCREANGITYCYCKAEACNSPDKKLEEESEGAAATASLIETTDDEDLIQFRGSDYHGLEGSGGVSGIDDEYEYLDTTDSPFFSHGDDVETTRGQNDINEEQRKVSAGNNMRHHRRGMIFLSAIILTLLAS